MDVVLRRDGEATQYIEGESIRIMSAASLAQDDQFLDPRWLGLTPDGEDIGLGHANPAPFPITEDWTEVNAAGEPAGIRIVERRFTIGADAISDRLWIDTARGLNVIRREMRGAAGDFTSVVKSTLRQWPGGVWLPARVERGVVLMDGRTRGSVIEVGDAEFGCEFAASEFEPAALGAPAGTSVFDTRQSRYIGHFDGSRIVRREVDDSPPLAAAATATPAWGWVGAVGMVALIALLASRRRGRRVRLME